MSEAENSSNTKRGKVARLPERIRDEVCRRLHDGETAAKILPWLNALPQVQRVIAEDFEGLRINDQNLSAWRNTGYQEWVRRRERVDRTRELARYAAEQAKADGSSIADGAKSIASGKLLELLEAVDDASGQKMAVEELVAVTGALTSLRVSEQNDVRLQQNDRRLKQNDTRLALEREKFQRDSAEIALKVLSDQRAKEIEGGAGTNAEKIQAMGKHLFGELWKETENKGQV